MSHEQLRAIAAAARNRGGAFEAISELGRYPQSEPVKPERLQEAAEQARHDARVLWEAAERLDELCG